MRRSSACGRARRGPRRTAFPPHLAAKAAQALGPEAFAALHPRLLGAYFEQSRDISRVETLRELWSEAALPEAGFAACFEPDLLERTLTEHNEAVSLGITGVPALRVAGTDAFVTGAQPLATVRRWIERLRAGVLDEAS